MSHVLALVTFLLGAASLAAQEVRYGPATPLGDGTVRTYLLLDANGASTELGVAISETAMATLPDLSAKPPMESFIALDLELPEGSPAPYTHVGFDWNSIGHPPIGIYTLPHFDFHFYMIDVAAKHAILPAEGEMPAENGEFVGTEFDRRGLMAPEPGYMPAHYVNPGGTSVPMMGAHWIDPASHEFHGQAFDKTMIYGTWEGKVIFVEPMITRAFIEATPDATFEMASPEKVPAPGWYPTAYAVRRNVEAKEYRIAITGFADRN
jgi:hypothetical protein